MIIRGSFKKLSLAVYGSTVPDVSSATIVYEPRTLTQAIFTPIPTSLDPANREDPSELARSLLTLIPDAPDLQLIIRLMFCL